MKKPILLALGGSLLLAATAAGSSAKSDCLREARVGFKADLISCKGLDGKREKKLCVKEARYKVKAAKRACSDL